MAVASLLIPFILVLASEDPASVSDGECLAQAESAFRAGLSARGNPGEARGHFQEAARLYEELNHLGIHNASLCRNLGNAYLLAGDLPRAILAYRRGLEFNPCDTVLRANLNYARSQVVYAEPMSFGRSVGSKLPDWLPYFDPNMRFGLTFLLTSLGWVFFFRWWILRTGPMLGMWLISVLLAGLLAVSLVAEDRSNRQAREHPLVVIAEDGVLMRKGNGLSYPRRYDTPLHRGVEARLLFARGNWLQIELAGGEVGWVPRGYVLVDEP